MLDERKFFGYMDDERCMFLMDISELGLKAQQASGVLPRFYMKYLDAVWMILFLPGKRDAISGHSPDIDADEVSDDEDLFDAKEEEQRMITKETKVAQQFDIKLTEEIPLGAIHIVNNTRELCGWNATMLKRLMLLLFRM